MNLEAAKNTSSEFGVGGSLELGHEVDGPGLYDGGNAEGGFSAGITAAESVKSTTTSIKSAEGITIKGGTINNQEATLSPGNAETSLQGKVVNTEAQNSDFAIGVEGGYKSQASRGDDSQKTGGSTGSDAKK